MPSTFIRFVLIIGWRHQVAIAILSILLFFLDTAPLEIQRRIVNATTATAPLSSIVTLVAVYICLAIFEGLIKLALNIYRGWIGEKSSWWLRVAASGHLQVAGSFELNENVQVSVVLAEADPVGAFVANIVSEPLLQAGILFTVAGYLFFIQPQMALAVYFVFLIQLGFVPLMQLAINRRVEGKVVVLRDVSGEILAEQSAQPATGFDRLFAANMDIFKLKYVLNFFMNLVTQSAYATVFLIGAYFVTIGKTELGTIVAFLSGLSKVTDPWGSLISWYQDWKVTEVKYGLIRAAGQTSSQEPIFPHPLHEKTSKVLP